MYNCIFGLFSIFHLHFYVGFLFFLLIIKMRMFKIALFIIILGTVVLMRCTCTLDQRDVYDCMI